ncbi:hypothetical protein Dd1591_3410 [Dickeya chrysanthemi Ech1591]|uniref:Uncharacterized protein n=2 Tax=Dickeya chrysanthemi TaxID=556 RepID=C6CJJ1_DICC1|nr:hypothetical protein Dd1591_3410 [Dickeya chrysanthemi Ech1591]
MVNIFRSKTFTRISIIIVSLISFTYWYGYMHLSKKSIPKDQYNNSHVEGVKLSRHQDLRGVIGSLNQRHQYGEYLSEATYYIAKNKGKRFLSDNIAYPTWLRYVNNNKISLSSMPLLPIWSDDFIFGFSNKSTFKILEKNILLESGVIPKDVFIGRTAILKNENENEDVYTTITDIDNLGNITVKGYVPYGFFPTSIRIPSGKKQSGHMMFESDSMGWIRGGKFTLDSTGYTYAIRPISSLNLSNMILENGDTLSWDGTDGNYSAKILSVYNLNNTYIVKLDKKFPPYFDFRKNIINVTRQNNKDNKQEMILNIDTDLINDDFFFGKNRNTSFVVYSTGDITPGNIVVGEGTKEPLYVSKVVKGSNVITVDLFRSAVINECLNLNPEGSYDSCIRNLDLSKFEYTNAKWAKENLTANKKYDDFGPWEMWNRGGDLSIQYATNIVKHAENPPPSKDKDTLSSDAQSSHNGLIWEIYPGSLLNIFYGTNNPAPTEMLIHVLGREARDKYYSSFTQIKPEYISFAKPERFTPWLLNWHWPFFRNIVNNYDLVVDKNEFSLWHITNKNKWDTLGPVKLKLQGDFNINKQISLNISKAEAKSCDIKLVTAVVKYDIKNPISHIPLVGKLSRYLLEIEGTGLPSNLPVSLPWSENTFSFPIFYRDGFNPVITPRTLSNFLDLTSMSIKEITLYQENADANNIYRLYYDYPVIGDAAKFECDNIRH